MRLDPGVSTDLSRPCLTTSWDDGHPLDWKVAELLDKYDLPGTFYVPRRNAERAVMDERAIASLSRRFEIGAHTLSHRNLGAATATEARAEIIDSRSWLADVIGEPPKAFCYPAGRCPARARESVRAAGFRVARTNELFATGWRDPYRLATTLQIYPHSLSTYLRHFARRARPAGVVTAARYAGHLDDLKRLVSHFVQRTGPEGVLHVWGHSWEIEACGLWEQLEHVFRLLASLSGWRRVPNGSLV